MAVSTKAANRYARAIFELLSENKGADNVISELTQFSEVLEKDTDLKRALTSHVFAVDKQKLVVEDVTKAMKLGKEASRILVVIVEAKRMRELSVIMDRLRVMVLEASNVIPIRVVHSVPLTDDERTKIEGKFAKVLGRGVKADYVLDASILGGLRVDAEGKTYDGSLTGWLSSFEEQLVGGIS